MSNRPYTAAALLAASTLLTPASAFADGEILLTHAKALAGNVTPGDPPGYPIILSQPGSFQVASNLFTAANKITIQVTSANVAIDLNGFTLHGSGVAWYGIVGAIDNVTIRNGTIIGFDYDGIKGAGANWIVEDMRVVDNGRDGIAVIGSHSSVRDTTVTLNGDSGIRCFTRCLVEGSNSSSNGAEGIVINSGIVLGNAILFNTGYGISGGSAVGYGNNTLYANNGGLGDPQVSPNTRPLHPNYCLPACP